MLGVANRAIELIAPLLVGDAVADAQAVLSHALALIVEALELRLARGDEIHRRDVAVVIDVEHQTLLRLDGRPLLVRKRYRHEGQLFALRADRQARESRSLDLDHEHPA